MYVIWLLIVGAAAGFIASRFMKKDMDLVQTIAFGIGGALIGGMVLRTLLALTGWAAGFVGAILGAMLLIWLWGKYGPKS